MLEQHTRLGCNMPYHMWPISVLCMSTFSSRERIQETFCTIHLDKLLLRIRQLKDASVLIAVKVEG